MGSRAQDRDRDSMLGMGYHRTIWYDIGWGRMVNLWLTHRHYQRDESNVAARDAIAGTTVLYVSNAAGTDTAPVTAVSWSA